MNASSICALSRLIHATKTNGAHIVSPCANLTSENTSSNKSNKTKAQRKTVCLRSCDLLMRMRNARDAHAADILFNNTRAKQCMGSKASKHIPNHYARMIFNAFCLFAASMRWCYSFDGSKFLLRTVVHSMNIINNSMVLPFDFGSAKYVHETYMKILRRALCLRHVLCVIRRRANVNKSAAVLTCELVTSTQHDISIRVHSLGIDWVYYVSCWSYRFADSKHMMKTTKCIVIYF